MYQHVTLEQFYMGRDKVFAHEWSMQVGRNAIELLGQVNDVLELAAAQGITPHAGTHGFVASGWRPRSVNDLTSNAGKHSPHIAGLAIDLHDWLDRSLARWSLRNLDVLETHGLYLEDPRWTPVWVHWQLIAPASGRRVFIPSSAPALALALPEQTAALS